MQIYARQGDLVIQRLTSTIKGELAKGTNVTFAGDSSGHPHTLVGACLFRRDGLRTFVRVEEKLTIPHGSSDGHKDVVLMPASDDGLGDYEIGPLRERGAGVDRAVED